MPRRKRESVFLTTATPQSSSFTIAGTKFIDICEWCFQFDEDEPQIFAWTDDDLNKSEDPKVIFTITNVENSYITFQNGKTGKIFKLFARELTNEGIELRNKQKESFKTIENGLFCHKFSTLD